MAFGTLNVLDTIGARRAAAADYLHLYDETELYRQITLFLNAHNLILSEMMSDLITPTMERFITIGSNDTVNMIDADEYSRPDTQKVSVSPTGLGLPLRAKQVAWGVTRLYMQNKTVGELDQLITAVADADTRDLLKSIRQALFNPTNNTAYIDRRVDNAAFSTTFPLRALLNADSAYVAPDPYGNKFDSSTHTHFLGTSSFANTDLDAGINTVNEHYLSGTHMRVYAAKNMESTIRGFTGFYPYYDARLTLANTLTVAAEQTLDLANTQDRAIGVYGQGEVWIKPWVPSGYVFFFSADAPKPLAMRTRTGGNGNLMIAADLEIYPLRAQMMEREYGVGVVERANGACLDTGHSSYNAPASWVF